MSATNELHDAAMELAHFAMLARSQGNDDAAATLFQEALQKELAAINELELLGRVVEPTYSVLHRSAGTLALNCNEHRLAERLVAKALAGEPPHEIAEELRDLLEQVYFLRHLSLRGLVLGTGEMQMSISGRQVGFGFAKSNELTSRIGDSARLIQRIIERRLNRDFRDRGRPSKDIEEQYQLFVSVPRAASFAVTFQLTQSVHQMPLPGLSDTTEVVNEFVELIRLANGLELAAIQELIPDPAYLRNFLGLAKKLAPDGERVRQVGFTVTKGIDVRSVELVTPSSSFPAFPAEASSMRSAEPVEVRGTLLYADATRDASNRIRVVDNDYRGHVIEVPKGIMNDIVRPMWDMEVEVVADRVRRTGRDVLMLRDIRLLDADLDEDEITARHISRFDGDGMLRLL